MQNQALWNNLHGQRKPRGGDVSEDMGVRCCTPAADRALETNAALSQEPYVPREKNETQFLGADPPLGVYLQKPSFQRDR